MVEMIQPVSPGELLNEEFLIPMGITKYRLAKELEKIVPLRERTTEGFAYRAGGY